MSTQIFEMLTKGYVSIAYPEDLRKAVEEAVESWKKFCELPESAKSLFSYSNTSAGIGYEMKSGDGPKGDHKENFDFTCGAKFADTASGKTPLAAEHFLGCVNKVSELIQDTIFAFADSLEERFDFSGQPLGEEVRESVEGFFIRFIHYFGAKEIGEETATAHVDQSAFTLHLFESTPGFQYLPLIDREKWTPISIATGNTVILPAMQLQLKSECTLRATCHRVVETKDSKEHGRYSAVCFVKLRNTPEYDKFKHGRLQERSPGFNYQASINEFREYFKP